MTLLYQNVCYNNVCFIGTALYYMMRAEERVEQRKEYHYCTVFCYFYTYVSLIRQAMAKLFWELGEEPITSALAASRIYHAMAKNLPRHEANLKDVLLTCER